MKIICCKDCSIKCACPEEQDCQNKIPGSFKRRTDGHLYQLIHKSSQSLKAAHVIFLYFCCNRLLSLLRILAHLLELERERLLIVGGDASVRAAFISNEGVSKKPAKNRAKKLRFYWAF